MKKKKPGPYKLEMMKNHRVIFFGRFDLHAEAWARGERWTAQDPETHTYKITDQTDRQPWAV